MSHSINSFSELNTDGHPVNTKPTVMTDALNATLTTRGENQLILQNLAGTDHVATLSEGYQPLGVEVFNDIAYIISGKFDANGVFISGEIGTYPSPDWTALLPASNPNNYLPLVYQYSPLRNFCTSTIETILNSDTGYQDSFNTIKLNFAPNHLIEIELQPSYDDSVNIIFTDDKNPVRLVNSRFRVHEDGKRAAVAQRRQTKDTNTYSNARFQATRLIRQPNKITDLTFLGVQTGGVLKGGNYRFYFRLMDTDGSLTDVIEESRLVAVAYEDHGTKTGEVTDKLVRFRLSNLDRSFSAVKVYYSFSEGETAGTTVVYEIENIYDYDSDDVMDITIYGSEKTKVINKDILSLDYSSVGTVKTITQYNDRLVLGNITNQNNNYQLLKDLSQRLKLVEIDTPLEIRNITEGYANPDNVYHYLGYWAGETYEIGIVYILKDGQGITPVFPIRGGDNYYDTFSYLSSSPINTDDGFAVSGQPTENRHGAYRTNKDRRKLYGPTNNLTDIRHFKVDVGAIRSHSYITTNTDGFFFVRKERKKDAIVQGYICNAYPEPIGKGIPTSSNLAAGPEIIDGSNRSTWVEANGVLVDMNGGLGMPSNGVNTVYEHTTAVWSNTVKKTKIMPAPGRSWEITRYRPAIEPLTQTYQGAIKDLEYDGHTSGYIRDFWSFYSSDQLVDPQLFASIFNNEAKGLMIDPAAVSMLSESIYEYAQGSSVNTTWNVMYQDQIMTGHDFTLSGWLNISNPNNYKFIVEQIDPTFNDPFAMFDAWRTEIYTADPLNANILNGSLTIQIIGRDPAILNKTVTLVCTVSVDISDPYNVIPTITIPATAPGAQLTIAAPITLVGTMTPGEIPGYIMWGPWAEGDNYWDPSNGPYPQNPLCRNFVWNIPTITLTEPVSGASVTQTNMILRWRDHSWDQQITFNGVNSDINTVGSLFAKSHYFHPELMTPLSDINPDDVPEGMTFRRNWMQYIYEGQDAYANHQFASRADRNIYYGERHPVYVNSTPSGPWMDNPNVMFFPDDLDVGLNGITMPEFDPTASAQSRYSRLWQHMVDFEDYVGLKTSVYEPKLLHSLHNDWEGAAFNIYSSEHGAQGMIKRWGLDGVRWGVQANVHLSPHGVIPTPEWKIKYGSASTDESYFAITKRYKWADITTVNDEIDLYGGDCFLTYTYKRVQKPLGIPGVPTATDWKPYDTANRACGLVPHGIIFPMILECNYNTALRAFEKKDEAETLLYGKDRSFYPIDSVTQIRSSRQTEAKNYNHGYSWLKSDKFIPELNDRAPSLNINYGNRIMVSAPSVAGNFENGYTNFAGLNFRDYNKQYGEITALITHGDYAYCIFESGIGVIPINQRTMVTQETGGVYLDDAQVLAEKMQIVSSEYGSDQQFSVIKTDSHVYGVDLSKNKVWRISSEGGSHRLDLISDFAVQTILNQYKKRIVENTWPMMVKTNYDREKNDVIFSFFNINNGQYTTDLNLPPIVIPNPGGVEEAEHVNYGLSDTSIDGINNGTIEGETPNINIGETLTPEETIKQQKIALTKFKPILAPVSELKPRPDKPIINITSKPVEEDTAPVEIPTTNEILKSVLIPNKIGSLYWNETLGKWISRLSWNPLWMFNLTSNLYSFNAIAETGNIWKHFSESLPWCHIYGEQHKFIFEFMIVDNASAQKILHNLQFICNRTFPGRVTYKLLENDIDYETFASSDNGYVELLKQRHEPNHATMLANNTIDQWNVLSTNVFVPGGPVYFTMASTLGDFISQEESERLVGGYVIYSGIIYIIGASFENNGVFYNEILDQNGINVLGSVPAGWTFSTIDFGIIKQNMEYIEDHLYVEVGNDDTKSLIRDKAIRVRVMYEGYDYTTVQSVISQFVYSFS